MMTSTRQYRPLQWWEIRELEQNGCVSSDWGRVHVCDGTDLTKIRNVRFAGDIRIGADVTIENVGLLEMETEALCGIGTEVCVLDETGSRTYAYFRDLRLSLRCLSPATRHGREVL